MTSKSQRQNVLPIEFYGRLLVLLFAASCCSPGLAAQNVVVVLDDSGSMDERMREPGPERRRVRKIDAAKQALMTVLESLPDDAQVGVALLNGRINRQPWLLELGPVDIHRTREAMKSVRAKGGTPLGQFMKVAGDALLEMRAKDYYGSYRMLVVTDGEAGDAKLVERYLPDIMGRGITVDVIGVDMKSDHSLATQVHSYRRADDPGSLTKAIKEVFAETTSDASDAGESDFALLQGLPSEFASAALAALADTGNHPIGELPRSPQQDIDENVDQSRSGASGHGSGQPGRQQSPPIFGLGKILIFFIIFFAFSSILRALFRAGRQR